MSELGIMWIMSICRSLHWHLRFRGTVFYSLLLTLFITSNSKQCRTLEQRNLVLSSVCLLIVCFVWFFSSHLFSICLSTWHLFISSKILIYAHPLFTSRDQLAKSTNGIADCFCFVGRRTDCHWSKLVTWHESRVCVYSGIWLFGFVYGVPLQLW